MSIVPCCSAYDSPIPVPGHACAIHQDLRVEVTDRCPPDIETLLQELAASAQLGNVPAHALSTGLVAARMIGGLAEDAPLAAGALLHQIETDTARPAPAELAHRASAEAVKIAAELQRLGEFGRGARWSADGGIPATQAETLRKMLLAVVGEPRLVVARIALQCARLRAARDADPALRHQLAAESRAVFAPLANRLGIWQLKWELEDLAFRWLEPDAYRDIAAALAERRSDRERWVVDFVAGVATELHRAGVAAEVYGRPKHIYSIWRKMQRKQLALAQLFDLRAIRIVCASVPDCYAALGVVHSLWTYIPGEFDDYIATPKDNFYRSIHTAVIGPGDKPVEVQIRTAEMQQHAELGVAAHWRYKEGGARDTGYERKIEWVRRLLDSGDARDGDQDFIERVRGELFEDRIYTLTPRGEVVDLPRDATALDFAYHVHTSLGHRCRGAKVNGRIVPLTQSLANGEIVEIITGRAESPSRDWLAPEQGFLRSPRSRAKVRAWFRKLDAGDNSAAGRDIVQRELTRLGAGSELISALVGEFKCSDAEALCRLVGEGEISTNQLSQAIARRMAPPAHVAPAVPAKRKPPAAGGNPLEVEGVGDLPMTLARCCVPMRPQPVVGYVTLGRGVTVHAAVCASLARMRSARPERVLEVRWRGDAHARQSVEITVTAWDRRGLVRDLSDVLAAEELSIESLNTSTQPGEGTARSVLRVGVRDLAQLARVVATLARIPNVTAVRRSA